VDMELSPSYGEMPGNQQPLVLVVDDNEDNLLLLAVLLEPLDCALLTASDGHTALELAQRYQPALILLDMMLPDIDGMEILSRLRQNPGTAMVPVIAVTAMARAEDRDRILSAGFNEYVSKPYAVDEFEVLLRHYLGR